MFNDKGKKGFCQAANEKNRPVVCHGPRLLFDKRHKVYFGERTGLKPTKIDAAGRHSVSCGGIPGKLVLPGLETAIVIYCPHQFTGGIENQN